MIIIILMIEYCFFFFFFFDNIIYSQNYLTKSLEKWQIFKVNSTRGHIIQVRHAVSIEDEGVHVPINTWNVALKACAFARIAG